MATDWMQAAMTFLQLAGERPLCPVIWWRSLALSLAVEASVRRRLRTVRGALTASARLFAAVVVRNLVHSDPLGDLGGVFFYLFIYSSLVCDLAGS